MTSRSTRTKLRFQCVKALNDLDRAMKHLQYLDFVADGESPYINNQMAQIVTLIEGVRSIIIKFREGL